MNKGFFLGALFLATAVAAMAQPTGRELVDSGKLATVTGRLTEQDDEYYVVTNQGRIALHLGPEWYRDEIRFPSKARGEVTVQGYLDKKDMSPSSITVDGRTYTFRDKDGQPMWRGAGGDRNGQGRGGRGRTQATGHSS